MAIYDIGSVNVVIFTFVLFVAALFKKGFTHDPFWEIGGFLVSVKLIMMAYNNLIYIQNLRKELKEINVLI
ncbi:MAG: hypothetical protein C0611_14950 [Desulfobacteraceae bacterium]|nr:MAG: hypothetical protein C0611_14950 [Desulfobacteraceae bacterium]